MYFKFICISLKRRVYSICKVGQHLKINPLLSGSFIQSFICGIIFDEFYSWTGIKLKRRPEYIIMII